MNNEEALEELKEFCYRECDKTTKCTGCWVHYARLALEKQIPKKPLITTMEYVNDNNPRRITNCPYCYEVKKLSLWDSLIDKGNKFCRRCGQAIDWSENNEA